MRFKIDIGDPHDDGHGKHDEYIVETNKTNSEILTAYKASVELTGLAFDDTPIVVNGVTINWQHPEYDDRKICVEYESYSPSKFAWSVLKEHGIEETDVYGQDFVKLFLAFVKLSLPDLEYQIVPDTLPYLNINIGYGLYH